MNYDVFEQLCKENGTSPTALTEKLGLSKGNTTSWKKGGNPSVEVLLQLSVELNCTTDYLLTGKEKSPSAEQSAKEQLSPDEQELLEYFSVLSHDTRQKLLGRAELLAEQVTEKATEQEVSGITIKHSLYMVSAGTGFELGDGDNWDEIEVPDTYEARKADFCLTVSGDSMEPRYSNGDIVLVKKTASVDEGQICVYRIEGKGYIKKFGRGRLISLNSKYRDIMLSSYDLDSIECIGLVIGKV
ncbi:MAG: XRE family transcriptional regulator [Huintestinicola sp.]